MKRNGQNLEIPSAGFEASSSRQPKRCVSSPSQRSFARVDGQALLGQSFRHLHAHVATHISPSLVICRRPRALFPAEETTVSFVETAVMNSTLLKKNAELKINYTNSSVLISGSQIYHYFSLIPKD